MKKLNFGRNVQIDSMSYFTPNTEAEVLDILNKNKGRSIRCMGRLHSWSQVLDSPDILLDLSHFDSVRPNSDLAMSVDVGAGCQIKRLLSELEGKTPWTLPSVGFITEQTIAGAISTGTHGSGRHSLSHYVAGVRVARYDSQTGNAVIVDITDGDELRAARCSLGCLGVILSVTIPCRPKYLVEEHFREYEQLDDVLSAEQEYPLQQFYLVPWRWSFIAQHRRESEAGTSKAIGLYHWYRFLVLDIAMHWLILLVVRVLRIQVAVKAVFRWLAPACVIRNWRVTGPSSSQLVMEHELFRHVEIELFVQRHQLPSALLFLKNTLAASACLQDDLDDKFRNQIAEASCTDKLEQLRGRYCHHYPICVRKILPDDTLVSMASNEGIAIENGTDTESRIGLSGDEAWYSITLTNYDRGHRRNQFEELASFLCKSMKDLFDARPHWGKLCPLPTEALQSLYPAFNDFRRVCDQVDKDGVFRNPWTRSLLRSELSNEGLSQLNP
ncbi:MAG: FAD-binding protein [Pirellulaceae bacterium]|nr:FAD-binding protein [Pirellulaceae bacterium]